ncbi:MAG TPA: hypothetical protein VHS06_08945 [Chloroflexota bacterium]|nr:hypothetical protein [Chloroflexota bacterium]
MSTELGRIEKPAAEQFVAERKIYLVPLVFSPSQPTKEYADIYERYWSGVREHLLKLEGRIGSVVKVYHESVGFAGEDGLKAAEELSDKSGALARSKVDAGAVFEALEDPELVSESFDWQRCLMIGLESRAAAEKVVGFYSDITKRRYELMSKRIDETLKPGEAGLLFISEDHRVQFPTDVRVFFVSPPALDEVHRWLRDQRTNPPTEQ